MTPERLPKRSAEPAETGSAKPTACPEKRGRMRRSVERPCDQANNGQYGADYCGDVGNSLVMVAGAHAQNATLNAATFRMKKHRGQPPGNLHLGAGHQMMGEKDDDDESCCAMFLEVRKRPNRHQGVVLRSARRRRLRALFPGSARQELGAHRCTTG